MPLDPGQRRILVVDDKAVIRNVLRTYLMADGYEVLEADSGVEALKTLRTERVDLILLDIMMPLLDGFQTVEKIRADPAISPQPPVVMVTAKGGRQDVVVAIQKGATDYVVKPFTKAIVLEKVHKYVPKPGAGAPPAPPGPKPPQPWPKPPPASL